MVFGTDVFIIDTYAGYHAAKPTHCVQTNLFQSAHYRDLRLSDGQSC